VIRQSANDEVTVVAAGTWHEALKHTEQLQQENTHSYTTFTNRRDPGTETQFAAAQETNNRFITVEDHWPEGGLGEAVWKSFRSVMA